ncbi:MAG: LamG-like jellyroll fold domain-containing protein [Bacteroidota bacterium]
MKTIKILACSLMAASGFVFTSCGDDDGPAALPPIGGYNTADEIGTADLLAYWPLDGDTKESVSGAMPSNTVGASWVSSNKGQGLKLTAGFVEYPSISALNLTSGSITVSCWAKVTNTKPAPDADSHISPLISFTGGPNANVGNLAIFGNTHGLVTSDTIQMKAEFHFKKPDGTDFGGDAVNMTKMEQWMIDDNANGASPAHAAFANKIGGQWAHVVFTYDGPTATARLYVNGVKINNPAWEVRNNGDAMPMTFFTPGHPIIGALNTVANGTNIDTWNAPLTGEVDEIRVWKKVLVEADINALYQLEAAGR